MMATPIAAGPAMPRATRREAVIDFDVRSQATGRSGQTPTLVDIVPHGPFPPMVRFGATPQQVSAFDSMSHDEPSIGHTPTAAAGPAPAAAAAARAQVALQPAAGRATPHP